MTLDMIDQSEVTHAGPVQGEKSTFNSWPCIFIDLGHVSNLKICFHQRSAKECLEISCISVVVDVCSTSVLSGTSSQQEWEE